jgi:SAM-dependent methyltransferase
MARADKYADWTFSLFAKYVHGRVLEIGCGVGTYTRLMTEHCQFERLLSIDVSQDAIVYCRANMQHSQLEFRQMDARDVSGEFDTVICMNVLEHIEDDLGALRSILAALRPGGTLFLLVPAHKFFFTPWDTASGHFRRYSKRDLAGLLSKAGGFPFRLNQFYFNAIGGLGYFWVFKALGRAPQEAVMDEIALFDRWVVPVMRRIEGNRAPFGISLVSVVAREG